MMRGRVVLFLLRYPLHLYRDKIRGYRLKESERRNKMWFVYFYEETKKFVNYVKLVKYVRSDRLKTFEIWLRLSLSRTIFKLKQMIKLQIAKLIELNIIYNNKN